MNLQRNTRLISRSEMATLLSPLSISIRKARRSAAVLCGMHRFLCLLLALTAHAQVIDGKFPVVSNLKAGAAKVDITPAEVKDITVAGHTRVVNGVRDPLRAGVLVLDDGETKAAIVTMDVIGAWEDMVALARAAIEKETGVPAANIMICASHNHSGPGWVENMRWASDVIKKLAAAAKEAASNMRPTSIGLAEDRILSLIPI